MIKRDFNKQDSHFWVAFSCGLTLFVMGMSGVLEVLPGVNLGLSWLVQDQWPITHLEEMPWTAFIALSGFLLLLDAARVFPQRITRFGIWLYAMLVLWATAGLMMIRMLYWPHTVGLTMAYVGLALTYTLLFLKGPPIVGKNDLTWED